LFQIQKRNVPLLMLEWFLGFRFIASLIVVVVPCLPLRKFWDRTIPGKCINIEAYFTASLVTNIATDLVLLIFPVPIIWHLRLFTAQKIAAYAAFVLGGLIIIISTLRLVSNIQATNDPDVTWALLPFAIWTIMETNIAVFCACIPAMRPLLRFVSSHERISPTNEDNTDIGGQVHKKWWPSIGGTGQSDNKNFRRMDYMGSSIEENLGIYGPRTVITANRHVELQSVQEDQNGIRVEQEIEWT